MIKFLLVILFFLVSCSSNTAENNFIFSDQMSFEEFKIKLNEYAKSKPYPKIDD